MEYKNQWWYFEDRISPSKGRVIRQVATIHTKSQIVEEKLPLNFVKFSVFGRNIGKELSFIESDKLVEDRNLIFINLGKLEDYPDADYPKMTNPEINDPEIDKNFKEVKTEIEYIETKPEFESLNPLFSSEKGLSGYAGAIEIEGPAQPEFSLTVPRGMKLRKSSVKVYFGENLEELGIEEIYVSKTDFNEVYNILVKGEDYDKYHKMLKKLPNPDDAVLILSYSVANKNRLFTLPFFGVLIFITGFIQILAPFMHYIPYMSAIFNLDNIMSLMKFDISVVLAQFIIIVSFLTLYLSLRRENYEIPFNVFVYISFLVFAVGSIFYTIYGIKLFN